MSGDQLSAIAAGAAATFRGWSAPDARFAVADDSGATRLITALVRAGVAVIEVIPEEGRLERLFTEGSAPAAGASTPAAGVPALPPAPASPDDESRFMPPPAGGGA